MIYYVNRFSFLQTVIDTAAGKNIQDCRTLNREQINKNKWWLDKNLPQEETLAIIFMKAIHRRGLDSEAVVRTCSSKYVLLKIWSKKSAWPSTLRGSAPGLALENYVKFCFLWHIMCLDNIFETEAWYFWENLKVIFGHLYTPWTFEGVDTTWWQTKWYPGPLLLVFELLVS